MKYFSTIFMLLLVVWPSQSFAQAKCSNKLLSEIIGQLPDIGLSSGFSGEVLVPSISKDKPVIVHRSTDGVINHIGIKFFHRDVIEKHPSPIYFFIERYFLELMLMESEEEIATKMKLEHVKISSELISFMSLKEGLRNVVSKVSHDFSVYITSNNNRYAVSCLNDNKLLVKISFPIRYELITGNTKLEAENSVYPQLLMFDRKDFNSLTSSSYMSSYRDSMFCANEDYYVTEDIVSTSFYKKLEDTYIPVFSSGYLEESVYNLFNLGYDWGVKANIEQSMYNKKLRFETSLAKLSSFLMDKGCSLYTGIRKYDKTKIEGVLMGVNMELGYQHIMMFSFDKRIFDHPNDYKVDIKMFSYVPIHNISSLF